MGSKRVAFCVRNDFFTKFGGDTYQITEYIRYFSSRLNAKIVLLNEIRKFEDCYDVYIVVNLDAHYDAIGFYEYFVSKGVMNKVVVIPIHHSYDAISQFNSKRFGSGWSVASLFGGVYLLEKIKAIIIGPKGKDVKPLLMIRFFIQNNKKKLSLLLSCSKKIICISQGEYQVIMEDFGDIEKLDYKVVRNGLSEKFIANISRLREENKERNIDILVCGRIEQRKNQLEIASFLINSKYTVVFAGAINKNNGKYGRDFISIVESSKNLKYIGALPAEKMVDLYMRAKVHLSASWFEVSSLVDIEAFSAGCLVVSSKNGHSGEMLSGKGVRYIDPAELNLLPSIIDDMVINDKVVEKERNNFMKKYMWKNSSYLLESEIISVCNEN